VRPPAHLGPGCHTEVELGCADAKFSFDTARAHPQWFVVGLDIREKVLEDNRTRAGAEGLRNLTFAYVNLGVDLDRVFGSGEVDRFHLLFPDPWFKSRHRKRRVIGPRLLAVLRSQLRPGGELHIASDVFEIALEAMAELEQPEVARLGFRNVIGPWSFWRGDPFAASSRREDTTLARGQRVWRLRYLLGGGDSR
jgi:tRNA (guanine-N7-)-methyltransferase